MPVAKAALGLRTMMPPVTLDKSPRQKVNRRGSALIGMAPESEPFHQTAVQLESGDRLLMYSDGVPDAMNTEGDVFGAARLIELTTRLSPNSVDQLVRTVLSELDKWRGDSERNDDITLLAFAVI